MNDSAALRGAFLLTPGACVGLVSLYISHLDRAIRFYEETIGFRLLYRESSSAVLGTNTPLLVLKSGARPEMPEACALDHLAVLLPGRADLARFLRHVQAMSYPLQRTADHVVSEAIYLADPNGNGIEICRDRPRSTWPWQNGRLPIANNSEPLDLVHLLSELEGDHLAWHGLPEQARIGHIHLRVADFDASAQFYRSVIGLNEVLTDVSGARFFASGSYHHHVAMNNWKSQNAALSHKAGTPGLHAFMLYLPDTEELARMMAHLQEVGVPFIRQSGGLVLTDVEGNRIMLLADMPRSSEEVLALINQID
jgi:catechol 2,3-dioxygenase